MPEMYSTYEAKARFSEILRKVRDGKHVYVSYRGKTVAEIRPVKTEENVAEALDRLAQQGVITRRLTSRSPTRPLGRRPGAVERFLESRD